MSAVLTLPALPPVRYLPTAEASARLRDETTLMTTLTAPVLFVDARNDDPASLTDEGVFILDVDDVLRTVKVAYNRDALRFFPRVADGKRRAWYASQGGLAEAVLWVEFHNFFENPSNDAEFETALNGPYCVEIARVWDTRIPQPPHS